jgi:hypothetical protein
MHGRKWKEKYDPSATEAKFANLNILSSKRSSRTNLVTRRLQQLLSKTTLAQQANKVWRMGFIAHGHENFYDALFEGLRDFGYVEGRNLIVERRFARGNAALFKDFAAEMVRLHAHRAAMQ